MKEKIRIGIIGTGFARSVQIPAFLQCADAEIVSVASAHRENAERVGRDFNIAHFTDDWRETIENQNADLICITTPPRTHREMTLFALERGKHVLCEKPMAMNVSEAAEMLDKTNKKSVLALIDHELRFVNGRQKVFEMIRNGDIGKVVHAKYNLCNAWRGDASLPWTWWSDETQGGGALGAIGSHVIDTFRWFLGAEISQVFCQLNTHIKQRPDNETNKMRKVTSDDETLMILRFSDNDLIEDATANVSISMVEAGNYRNTVEFFGTTGAIRVEDGGEVFFADIKESVWKPVEIDLGKTPPDTKIGGWSRGFLNFSHEIIKALCEGKTEVENAATFADGYKIQLVLDAARKSDATGAVVKL